MKIAFVFYNAYRPAAQPEELLSEWFTINDWATALTEAGLDISIFLRYKRDQPLTIRGVRYFFLKDRLPPAPKNWQLPLVYTRKLQQILRKNPPDLVHAHNLNSAPANLILRYMTPRYIPMLVQDHGSILPAPVYRPLQRLLFRQVEGLLFSARGQEQPWVRAGIITQPEKCYFVMENASPFSFQSRIEARRHTGMYGRPVFLWVGNLDENKDPLTILNAFVKTASFLPDPRLYMIYRQAPREAEVMRRINRSPFLQGSVVLLGAKSRKELANYYNSADYFLLGSCKEGSGYALIEALSCGLVPIVSDIPSFRSLTAGGAFGGNWQPGDERELLNQIQKVTARPLEEEIAKALAYYGENLSFRALAEKVVKVYRNVIGISK